MLLEKIKGKPLYVNDSHIPLESERKLEDKCDFRMGIFMKSGVVLDRLP